MGAQLRVWLVTVGEPLPFDGPDARLLRAGMLAEELANRGHQVTWFTSTFDHVAKAHRFAANHQLEHDSVSYRLVHSPGYTRNVSLRRLVDNQLLARRLRIALRTEPDRPDVLVASLPPVELCAEALRAGQQVGAPVVIDVRDLWPDIFADVLPAPLRIGARAMLFPMQRQARRVASSAAAIVGVSAGYLDWGLAKAARASRPTDRVIPLGYRRPPAANGRDGARLLSLGVDPSSTIAWFVGSFGRTYDLTVLAAAARHLGRAGISEVQVVISGAGEQEAMLAADTVDLPNVVRTGWLSAAEIAWMQQLASIGLMTYRPGAPQSLPNKLFEYLAAGLPVVSTLTGEAAELLAAEQVGLTAPPGDAAALADAIGSLAGEPERLRRMGAAARRLFDERFAADAVYAAYADHIEQLARTRAHVAKEIAR